MYEKLRSSYITPISLYPRTFLEYKAEYPRTCSGIQTLGTAESRKNEWCRLNFVN